MGLEIPTATLIAYASTAASLAGAAYGAYASNQAAKQSEMNAEAEANALRQEQLRKQQELGENLKRKAAQDKRFRASQLAAISGMGITPTVGSPLDLMVETAVQQRRDTQDMVYDGDLTQRELAYSAQSAIAVGQQQASNYRMQAGATLLSGLASAAGTYARTAQPASQRPY